tara:strand:- start:640 stop:783 length:144 start_codon:yes stop_codon:yes gene_type:complete
MKAPIKTKKKKLSNEINWKMRELFSEAALDNFINEVDSKYFGIKKSI